MEMIQQLFMAAFATFVLSIVVEKLACVAINGDEWKSKKTIVRSPKSKSNSKSKCKSKKKVRFALHDQIAIVVNNKLVKLDPIKPAKKKQTFGPTSYDLDDVYLREAGVVSISFILLLSTLCWTKVTDDSVRSVGHLSIHDSYPITGRYASPNFIHFDVANYLGALFRPLDFFNRYSCDLIIGEPDLVDAMLPQFGSSYEDKPALVADRVVILHQATIHTWRLALHKQKTPSRSRRLVAPLMQRIGISHMEKIFDLMDCNDAFKTIDAEYKTVLSSVFPLSRAERLKRRLCFLDWLLGDMKQRDQAKNFRWGSHKSILDHVMCIQFTVGCLAADAGLPLLIYPSDRMTMNSPTFRQEYNVKKGRIDRIGSVVIDEWEYTMSMVTECVLDATKRNQRHPGECRRAAGTCFKCGQAGHLQRDCKKNTGASSSGHTDKKPDVSGHVFALTQDQAANTSGTITGHIYIRTIGISVIHDVFPGELPGIRSYSRCINRIFRRGFLHDSLTLNQANAKRFTVMLQEGSWVSTHAAWENQDTQKDDGRTLAINHNIDQQDRVSRDRRWLLWQEIVVLYLLDPSGEPILEGPKMNEVTMKRSAVASEKLKEAQTRQRVYTDKHASVKFTAG
ncbi:zinc finger, CCHC-type, retrotransposon gag domain protein [Tanacetum coccineum]